MLNEDEGKYRVKVSALSGPSIVDQLYAGAELTHDFSVTVEISLACETRPQRQDAAAGPQEIEIFYQAGI
jgi:hypothetical protein